MMKRNSENVTRYTELDYNDYQEALEWFRGQGFNVNSSRYVSIMREIGEFGEGAYPADLIWGMSEVNTLHLVYLDILKDRDIGRKSVRKLLNGARYLKDENIKSSENSRNYLFELSLAGIFYKAGMDVSFDTKADFMFPVDDDVVGYSECKRVRSISNLQNNIEEAYGQIKTRCRAQDVGVVGIDVTRLMWEHLNEQLVCSSARDIGPFMKDVFYKVVSGVQGKYDFANCLMLIGYYHVPFIRLEDNSLQFYRGIEIDMKYHAEHLSPLYHDKPEYIHRAKIALKMMGQLLSSMRS
ncbi:hypothetical protein [Pectobacterium brasiliense]|uniref:hypothetical protein n=1 Tax=Pectobacterium brasiliense TaxID=180957 RepID=UPI001969147F|nr:hypothetical protein [Pectobacterium brasiliense]MBN3056028.1 hypothetical protein [Pectobacterium brasiliense]